MARLTLPLDAPEATLARVGGKALNLIRLTHAGFRVPPGFLITTTAYATFVTANHLDVVIADALDDDAASPNPALASPTTIEQASATVREAFRAGTIPPAVSDEILAASARHFRTATTPLAVRSSATAEDLPGFSFAGQQDTFLNVVGEEHLLTAVVDCWSSLWTARAIGYRLRNNIPNGGIGLAVVVQRLITAKASGVLFTADPLTGIRSRTVVDAVRGLGDTLVSGQVDPDHWEVNPDGRVLNAVPIHPDEPVLTDSQVRELTALAQRIQAEYGGTPQDVEWALDHKNQIHVLQARPITSLFPIPEVPIPEVPIPEAPIPEAPIPEVPAVSGGPRLRQAPGVTEGARRHIRPASDADALWFSVGAFQGMLRPITPAGRDVLIHLVCGAAVVFAGRPAAPETQQFIGVAGGRLWARVDGLLRHPFGARVLPAMLKFGEPGTGAIIRKLQDDPRWAPTSALPSPRSMLPALRFGRRVVLGMPLSLAAPWERRRRFDSRLASFVDDGVSSQLAASQEPDPGTRLERRLAAAEQSLATGLAIAFANFAPIMGPAGMLMAVLGRIAKRAGPEASSLPMDVLRALPGNPTTAMDLALWDAAAAIREDPAALAAVVETDPAELAARFTANELPASATTPVSEFLAEFGMRGVAEIDLGAPRWRDDPTQVFATLQSYLRIDSAAVSGAARGTAPDTIHADGLRIAEAAQNRLIELVRARSSLTLAALIRFVTSRLRILLGARETPKFALVQLIGHIREGLLASGRDLTGQGLLERSDDVCFLHFNELQALTDSLRRHVSGETSRASQSETRSQADARLERAIRELVATRRAGHDREMRRRQIPRLIAGDGHAWYEGLTGAAAGGIQGSPVSPGIAEGIVRIVHDPTTARLEAGEILVCAGTDPAWTPLFLTAAGVITEVGGLMTHGAVVAREFGLPAVVGVHGATTRLPTGTRIRLDGATGLIEVLTESHRTSDDPSSSRHGPYALH
ncbi:MAG TPA: PEP/pyruvate-binding domain-containing protein [Actinomycetaceae bacterium]|nr:PEP/pyruvate-binding domain-containing protein [Actinomycetaceae bacterium]